LGLSLADIGTALSGAQAPLAEVIERQIAQLDHEIVNATRLRDHLGRLRSQLASGQTPDLADWLETLETMSLYEKYFSPEELKTLPLHTDPDVLPEWSALVTAVQSAMDRGASVDDADVHLLALSWMAMLERGTGNNPAFLLRLHAINQQEPRMRERSRISRELERFVERAVVSARLAIFARYLDEQEMQRVRANYGREIYNWPALIVELRAAMADGRPAGDPHVQALAQRWMTLFRAYAGDDPATHQRIREAYAREPDLRRGSAVDEALLDYLRAAWAHPARQ
jgi:hypothetical protein